MPCPPGILPTSEVRVLDEGLPIFKAMCQRQIVLKNAMRNGLPSRFRLVIRDSRLCRLVPNVGRAPRSGEIRKAFDRGFNDLHELTALARLLQLLPDFKRMPGGVACRRVGRPRILRVWTIQGERRCQALNIVSKRGNGPPPVLKILEPAEGENLGNLQPFSPLNGCQSTHELHENGVALRWRF